MKLLEIVDLENQRRNVDRLKLIAKQQAKQARAAQAKLKIQKAQQQLAKANQV